MRIIPNTPKTKKRIVSKGEYMVVQTSRAVLRATAALSIVEVVVCLLLTFSLPFAGFGLVGWLMSIFCAIMAFRLGKMGFAKVRLAANLEDVVPLSRVNIGDLPAAESLVRASEQPLQEQQDILLRPAIAVTTTPADQLLRSATDQDTPQQEKQSAALQEDQPTILQENLVTPPIENKTDRDYSAAKIRQTPDEQFVELSGGQ